MATIEDMFKLQRSLEKMNKAISIIPNTSYFENMGDTMAFVNNNRKSILDILNGSSAVLAMMPVVNQMQQLSERTNVLQKVWGNLQSIGALDLSINTQSLFLNNQLMSIASRIVEASAYSRQFFPAQQLFDIYVEEEKLDEEVVQELKDDKQLHYIIDTLENRQCTMEEQFEFICDQIQVLNNKADNIEEKVKEKSKNRYIALFIALLIFVLGQIGGIVIDEAIGAPVRRGIQELKRNFSRIIQESNLNTDMKELRQLRFINKPMVNIRNGHRMKSKVIEKKYLGQVVVKIGKYRRWSQVLFYDLEKNTTIGWVQTHYLEPVEKQ